ncbi:hypothetical protein BKH43_05265 [Helicobacter sp. 13S00401-1]|uniref:DUF2443 family protein n=1 Tax=Helicobacter sp. 13S00401-1 TaxID=1905758 RepID=UPI000BA748FC|nr:DUF2443 family protein [Helicobacter sp. 13S00401-1]PAF50157.1 hypothetical protein BKH43_05265 [Helicobacter sp. 13S00401-1]
MFEKIEEIIRNIENLRDEITILLNMAKIDLIDYILIKRGSKDMPEGLSMGMLADIDEEVDKLKKQIDLLNKIKREMLIF